MAGIHNSEELLCKVFAQANDAILVIDPQRDEILEANPKACSLFGYAYQELVSLPISAIHPKEMPELLAFARAVFNKGDGWTDQLTCLTKAGSRLPAEVSASVIDIGGRRCLLALIRAVKRQQAEQILRSLFEGTAAVTGTDFFRLLVQHLASLLGVRYAFVAKLTAKNRVRTLAFWAGGDFLDHIEYDLAGTPCEAVLSGEVVHCPQDAQARFPRDRPLVEFGVVSYLGFPLRNACDRIVGHLAVMDDKPMPVAPLEMSVFKLFAERARAELERGLIEETLRRREAQLRVLANSLPALIAYVDATGRYRFNNTAYEAWFGLSAEHFKGRPVGEVFREMFDEATYRTLLSYLQAALSGRPQRFECELCHQRLGRRRVEMRYIPHREPGGRTDGFYALGTDITERKQAEQRLLDAKQAAEIANRAKTEFLTNVSHELRTPLNGILGYAQILKKAANLSSEQQDAVRIIQRCGEHLLDLINDLLDLSKIEAGRLELTYSEFRFPEFLRMIVETIRHRAQDKGIAFVYESLDELPVGVRGDEQRLRQILINLLGNAVKFTDRGAVRFRVGYRHGRARFEIEDTGIGIAPERLEDIFLPFHQIAYKDRSNEGSGLGLAICKRLSDALGATLSVQSTPGAGSLFRLELELPQAPELKPIDEMDNSEISGYQGSKITLLVVDDNPDNRSLLRRMLEPLGFVLIEATNGEEALIQAQRVHPRLILMDLVMPVLDGLETTRRLRRLPEFKEVVIIGISASAFEQDQQNSLKAGCTDFLPKPVRAGELLRCLQRHLQLDWIYAPIASRDRPVEPRLQESFPAAAILPPPAAVLGTLRAMAAIGDIQGIVETAAQIEQSDKRHAPFAQQLQQLAKAFEIKKIRQLLADQS